MFFDNKREEILKLAKKETPLFIYDLPSIEKQASTLLEASKNVIHKIFYAIKANSNLKVLQTLHKLGFGFECVSIEEVEFLLQHFEGIDKKDILFTPNFVPIEEYKKGLEHDVNLTVDNIYPIENHPEVFSNKKIFLRIDTTQEGKGHHIKVQTSGVNSKFGIPYDDVKEVFELTKKYNIEIIGLHAHVGSGILDDHEVWSKNLERLNALVESFFPKVEFIDVGGGLGVPYKPNDQILNLETVMKNLSNLNSKIKLIMEPGRFVVCNSGILLTKVTQLKKKSKNNFYVGVNTGMNSLMRPCLYESYHHIINFSKMTEYKNENEMIECDIVGNICESVQQKMIFYSYKEQELIVKQWYWIIII
eukprot:gene10651-3275_t